MSAPGAAVELEVHLGAIIFSPSLESLLLVRYANNSGWSFPFGSAPCASPLPGVAALVKEQLGLDVSDHLRRHHPAEATVPPGRRLKLFFATDVPPTNLEEAVATSAVAAVKWHPVHDVLSCAAAAAAAGAAAEPGAAPTAGGPQKDDSSSAAAAADAPPADSPAHWRLVVPFLPHLLSFLQRHPELRLGKDAATAAAVGELASLLVYQAATWKGVAPREHLAEFCRSKQFPEPCYSLIARKVAGRRFLSATCILSHLGVQISPEHSSTSGEEAEQSAALAAVVWLEGGLSVHSRHVRVVPVGFPPLLRPEALRPLMERTEQRRTQQWALQNRDLILQRLDQRRQSLAEELAGLERAGAALRDGRVAAGGREVAEVLGALTRYSLAETPPNRVPRPAKRARTAQQAAGGAAPAIYNGIPPARSAAAAPLAGGAAPLPLAAGGVPLAVSVPAALAAAAALRSPNGVAAPKSTVQELKELCDRRRWPTPGYEYTQDVLGHKCSLALPPSVMGGEPQLVASEFEPTKKRAKEVVAGRALQMLAAVAAAAAAAVPVA